MLLDNFCYKSAGKNEDEDINCFVELIGVEIDGQKVTSGKTFVADENWIKNLKIRVRNVSGKPFVFVSGKPFVFVGVSFGLIEGLNEKLAPNASWKLAFSFGRGKTSNPYAEDRKISDVIILKPKEEIELTFDDLPELYTKSSLIKVVGKMSQIVFISATVEFENGKQADSHLFIGRKQN